jgi:hypothetical protein
MGLMNDTPSADNRPEPTEPPFQFSMRAMFVVVAIVAILLGIVVALVRSARQAAFHAQCMNNLKQIGLALQTYHAAFKCFPPAYIPGPDGKPWHSWRVLILPELDSANLLAGYDFRKPWNAPGNHQLSPVGSYIYHCPAESADVPATTTSYLAVVGPGTAWPGSEPTRFEEFGDGASNSILVVEVLNSGIHWMEPRDLDIRDTPLTINAESGLGISSRHVGGACVLFADGTVRVLPSDLAAETLRSLLLINDGQPVDPDDL